MALVLLRVVYVTRFTSAISRTYYTLTTNISSVCSVH